MKLKNRTFKKRNIDSEKFVEPVSVVEKRLRPSKRGIFSFVGGLLTTGAFVYQIIYVTISGRDAKPIMGTFMIYNLMLSILFLSFAIRAKKDEKHQKTLPKIAFALQSIVIAGYMFMYLLGLK